MIIGGIINAASQNYGSKFNTLARASVQRSPSTVFCAGRFILGFGNSLSQLTSPMLLTEIVHPQHRAPFTTIYNCLWNLGSFCNPKISFPNFKANHRQSATSSALVCNM